MVIEVKLDAPLNASFPMLVTFVPISTLNIVEIVFAGKLLVVSSPVIFSVITSVSPSI